MIIDLNTQIWSSLDQLGPEIADCFRSQPSRWADLDGSPAAHERSMDCVDAAVVIGWRSERLGGHIPNELVADFVGRDPQRRIGVAGIDPMREDAVEQLEAAIDLGLSGICVCPASQGFHPAHSQAMRIYERCLELGMPVFVGMFEPVTAATELAFGRPALLDEVARSFPGLRLVMCQLGHPWVDETLVLLGKHRNVFGEISGIASRPWQLYGMLLNALSFGVMDKLLFGSGFPRELPARAIEALYSVNTFSQGTQLPSIPRAYIRGIVERDSLACLGIDAEVSPMSRSDATEDGRPGQAPTAAMRPSVDPRGGAADDPSGMPTA
ncbi:MAG: amidohydrolase family protein [Planctomycetota bacterium]|jgi:predicted TIM-barrel fold metal-dependent hydrolase